MSHGGYCDLVTWVPNCGLSCGKLDNENWAGTWVYLHTAVQCAQDLQARFRVSSMGCAMPSVDVILLCAKLAT